jgi:hypothetical protein
MGATPVTGRPPGALLGQHREQQWGQQFSIHATIKVLGGG